MGRRVGLIYRAKGMPSVQKQTVALMNAGVWEGDIWEGDIWPDKATRHILQNWFLSGRAIEAGDTLVVATLHAFGDTTRKQNSVRRAIEALGATVEVAATDEGPKRPRGRPPEHGLDATQQRLICDLWYDKNVPRPTVLTQAERIAGKPVSQAMIKRLCGMARKRPAK